MKIKTINLLVLLLFIQSCKMPPDAEPMDETTWQLGWRMIENSWEEEYPLADLQFDSLLTINKTVEERFLMTGIQCKLAIAKEAEALEIIANQPKEMQRKVCAKQFAKGLKICATIPKEKVDNQPLQLEIIKLFVADQAIRGNIIHDIITKYQIDTTGIKTKHDWSNPEEVNMDELIRKQLKELFKAFGFPTRQLVGEDAMSGVFYIIQHADGDKEWQKSQLINIEQGATKGDFIKRNYAYLYDRIKVNEGLPQRYGSQFAKVDSKNNIAELQETEDLANLNQRRKAMNMMPIEVYKRLALQQ